MFLKKLEHLENIFELFFRNVEKYLGNFSAKSEFVMFGQMMKNFDEFF